MSRLVAPFGLMLLLAGCATYRQAPLDEAFVEGALAPPDTHAVRIAAAELDHPYLRPLVFDLKDGLSPDEAAVLAVLANPQLRAVRAQRGVASAQLLAAGVLPNPQLAGNADFPVDDTTGARTALALGLSFDLTALLTRPAERAAAIATLQQVTLDIAWQEWLVAQTARQQVYDVVFLTRQAALAKEQEDALLANLRVLTEARQRRLATETDRAAAETAVLQARATRLNLAMQRDTTRQGLLRLLGLPPRTDIQLSSADIPFAALDTVAARDDSVSPDVSAADTTSIPTSFVPSLASLTAGLERNRLDLVALRYGYESQDARLRAAILRQFPSISFGLNSGRDSGNLLTLGPGLSIGLPFFDRNQGEVALARATREQLRQAYVARVFEASSLVDVLLTRFSDLRQQLRTAEASARAQRALVQTYGSALALGDADVLTYYNARTNLIAAEVLVLQLRQALADGVVALETVTGRPLNAP